MVSEVDEFLAVVIPRQREADTALHNGNAGPRMALWSHREPVTVFGAVRNANGWPEVEQTFNWLAGNFTNGDYSLDVLAAGASGDLAYVAGVERSTVSIGGEPATTYALRVTLVFRREEGEWKAVHRHADAMPGNEGAQEQLRRFK